MAPRREGHRWGLGWYYLVIQAVNRGAEVFCGGWLPSVPGCPGLSEPGLSLVVVCGIGCCEKESPVPGLPSTSMEVMGALGPDGTQLRVNKCR